MTFHPIVGFIFVIMAGLGLAAVLKKILDHFTGGSDNRSMNLVIKNNHIDYSENGKRLYSGTFDDAPPRIREKAISLRKSMKRMSDNMRRTMGDFSDDMDDFSGSWDKDDDE